MPYILYHVLKLYNMACDVHVAPILPSSDLKKWVKSIILLRQKHLHYWLDSYSQCVYLGNKPGH
jgi:hypothetical protein